MILTTTIPTTNPTQQPLHAGSGRPAVAVAVRAGTLDVVPVTEARGTWLDALRAIRLFTAKISDAVVEGRTASKDAGVPTEGEEQPETEGEAEPTYDYAFGESALGPGAQSASEASEAGSESGKPTSKSRKGPNAESGDSEHHPRAANEPATQPI